MSAARHAGCRGCGWHSCVMGGPQPAIPPWPVIGRCPAMRRPRLPWSDAEPSTCHAALQATVPAEKQRGGAAVWADAQSGGGAADRGVGAAPLFCANLTVAAPWRARERGARRLVAVWPWLGLSHCFRMARCWLSSRMHVTDQGRHIAGCPRAGAPSPERRSSWVTPTFDFDWLFL
jgi:hypothetical protein